MMPNVMVERRIAPRFQLILVAEVTEVASGTKLNARTSDVSRTGCYIDTLNPTPVGTPIRVKLTREGEAFESAGRIIYISPGLGMGVAFQEPVPADQQAILDRWLAEAAQG
jgi:hypothetical protein